jgi:serine/threonine-protein kinase
VVSNVGQPCTFTEVGRQERTLGGVAVVCQRRADGSYAWDPPPR